MLKRAAAPITTEAWQIIDRTAKRVLESHLSARHLIDFDGPHGWQHAAVNLGRLRWAPCSGPQDAPWGIRSAMPLVEVRVPLSLGRMELDNAARGCLDVDLIPLEDAARKAAVFEETAIYRGLHDGDMPGMIPSSTHSPVPLPSETADIPGAVAQCVRTLTDAGITGPYALVLGSERYAALTAAGTTGYPALRIIEEMLGGQVRRSPTLGGGVVLSIAGGDFRLVVGQDFSIGYTDHDHDNVELFITESFAFQIIERRGAIELRAP